jgi:hypothetical protein
VSREEASEAAERLREARTQVREAARREGFSLLPTDL